MAAIQLPSLSRTLTAVFFSTVIVITAVGLIDYVSRRKSTRPAKPEGKRKKVSKAEKDACGCGDNGCGVKDDDGRQKVRDDLVPVRILYGSMSGTAKRFSQELQKDIFALNVSGFRLTSTVNGLDELEQDAMEKGGLFIVIMSTWTDGVPPNNAKHFCTLYEDFAKDFRVSKNHLSKAKFAIFGLGSSEYDENHAKAAMDLNENLLALGAKQIAEFGKGDDSVDMMKQFADWKDKVLPALCEEFVRIRNADGVAHEEEEEEGGCGPCGTDEVESLKVEKSWEELEPKDKVRKSKLRSKKGKVESELERTETDVTLTEEDLINAKLVDSDYEDDEDEEEAPKSSAIMDLEDLGNSLKKPDPSESRIDLNREMVTPMQRKTLTKEGYKLIGSHSAVKLCSNPVGREWRWKIDDPHMIVEEAIEKHRGMINEFKGAPGVKPERLQEAFTVKHCALSLVGEPIMYPHINAFLQDLHEREISSFLVTNAQFPEKIIDLEPVTQLYVSVDAGTKDALKAIDRPLFKDFWERFTACLVALKEKRQRTVYRLTLVKGYNMQDIDNYCELVRMGEPDLIEIKGVTFSQQSKDYMTMKNVPWHVEVREFARAICDRMGGQYGLACEHAHSCCVLLANEKFRVDGKWMTWIDYPKFHALTRRYREEGITFSAEDYWAETPQWAVFGAAEEGFNPVDTRYRKNKEGKTVEIDYKSSESGCG
ncbi:S-adenosyl-L-methionine-dependent tRNA 4-demethylwyosine synthase [Phlyctochytrium planicorne]|nr:S-adenosyl-L-methionine-dependent tRNA 4-demethylwyosine synthase [Phlyctochytrium planicorne]